MPREHGAWAMLLQPFLGALLVLRSLSWLLLPALACMLLVFLIREPLIVLARQKWIWRDPHAEALPARKMVLLYGGLLCAAGGWLLLVWPMWIVAAFGFAASLMTALAVYMTIRNKQRAAWFQALSAAGLSSSCIVACLAVTGNVPAWGWWWWALHSAHYLTGILVVHVRLEARIQARMKKPALSGAFLSMRREAAMIQGLLAVGSVALLAIGKPYYALAGVLSAAAHFRDLFTAHTPAAIAMPMVTVGKYALVGSIIFGLLMIAGAVLSVN